MYDLYLTRLGTTLIIKFPSNLEIAFDWDETLIDSRAQFEHASRRSLEKYGTERGFGEFETEVLPTAPTWLKSFISNCPRKIHIISNKPHAILMQELEQFEMLPILESAVGDANKPNNPKVFTDISKRGLLFGDNLRNDLVGAITAGWEYQFMNQGFLSEILDIVFIEESV